MNAQRKEPVALVVDSSLNLLDLFYEILVDEGVEIELSNYTFEGIVMVEKLQPNIIILDFDREGEVIQWQLLQMLKMHEATAHIPIILAAQPLPGFIAQAAHLEARGIHLLYKPFTRDELRATVRGLLPLRG